MCKLGGFLRNEEINSELIYPPREQWCNAFHLTLFDKVEVVIVGQDPYHGEWQPNRHGKKGWLTFTNASVQYINEHKSGGVFGLGATKSGKDFTAFLDSG